MKPYILFFILILLLSSCSKPSENQSGIKDNLYREILKYQKENPIDKKAEKFLGEKHFVYQVSILPREYANRDDKNYSVFITMSVFGVGKEIKKNCYGIYEDDSLKRTVIYDEANLIDEFVNEKKKINLEKYIVKSPPIIDIIFPVKMYNINNGKLNFISEMPGNNHH